MEIFKLIDKQTLSAKVLSQKGNSLDYKLKSLNKGLVYKNF